jgi:hypothetical protein
MNTNRERCHRKQGQKSFLFEKIKIRMWRMLKCGHFSGKAVETGFEIGKF